MRMILLSVFFMMFSAAFAHEPISWETAEIYTIIDDDIARHTSDSGYFTGINVTQTRFTENGFDWHLIRFTNSTKPDGPLWVVPHDDENAAFESMIDALRLYGGTGIAVNSGPGSERRQAGHGRCGVRAKTTSSCDPNRNFSDYSSLFTAAILDQILTSQPVIALHTNSPGFDGDGHGGRGDITILDASAYRYGSIRPRKGGMFGVNQAPELIDYDTLGLIPYLNTQGATDKKTEACGLGLSQVGVHFWAENVGRSDGSLSNYIILNRPDIAYFNAESRRETDLAIASARHRLMVASYLQVCR
jgi:hypothetical protein